MSANVAGTPGLPQRRIVLRLVCEKPILSIQFGGCRHGTKFVWLHAARLLLSKRGKEEKPDDGIVHPHGESSGIGV